MKADLRGEMNSGDIHALHPDAVANRARWSTVNAEYSDDHAFRAWAADEITWGIFDVPESHLNVLGEVRGLDVVELGCGTAYFSAWLARRGARPVGVDVTPAQLETGRRCQEHFGIRFPLVLADAADSGLPSSSFDLVLSECGASMWCDPARWVPEAARLLRPGGRMVFHTMSPLVMMCLVGQGPAGEQLVHPQREIARIPSPAGGIEFHPSHSEWIRVLREAALEIDALHELYAPPESQDHPYYQLAAASWARQWPVEDIWIAHLQAR